MFVSLERKNEDKREIKKENMKALHHALARDRQAWKNYGFTTFT